MFPFYISITPWLQWPRVGSRQCLSPEWLPPSMWQKGESKHSSHCFLQISIFISENLVPSLFSNTLSGVTGVPSADKIWERRWMWSTLTLKKLSTGGTKTCLSEPESARALAGGQVATGWRRIGRRLGASALNSKGLRRWIKFASRSPISLSLLPYRRIARRLRLSL